MLIRPAILIGTLLLAGCTGTGRCYVALNAAGAPTAEACQTNEMLVVRPITADNAAFYTPPYVLAAFRYEGYISGMSPAARRRAVPPPGIVGLVLK